jgi:hypothetical protein
VTDTAELGWNGLNTVCSTGTCTADLGAVDLTGWTWASEDEVRSLFNEFIFAATGTSPLGGPTDFPFGDLYSEFNSTWAPNFLSVFTPTFFGDAVFNSLIGVTRTEISSLLAVQAAIVDDFGTLGPDFKDLAQPSLGSRVPKSTMAAGFINRRIPRLFPNRRRCCCSDSDSRASSGAGGGHELYYIAHLHEWSVFGKGEGRGVADSHSRFIDGSPFRRDLQSRYD